MTRWAHAVILLLWTAFVAALFANVEIQIEGGSGWASNLPTWRIEHHWLLDVFFGGRAMTGYHAWTLPCILAFFHLPMAFTCVWTWRLEARAAACFMLFWILEDALWFICNPAYGWAGLNPEKAVWHKHWLLGLPVDYWVFTIIGGALYWWSFGRSRRAAPQPARDGSGSAAL